MFGHRAFCNFSKIGLYVQFEQHYWVFYISVKVREVNLYNFLLRVEVHIHIHFMLYTVYITILSHTLESYFTLTIMSQNFQPKNIYFSMLGVIRHPTHRQ